MEFKYVPKFVAQMSTFIVKIVLDLPFFESGADKQVLALLAKKLSSFGYVSATVAFDHIA